MNYEYETIIMSEDERRKATRKALIEEDGWSPEKADKILSEDDHYKTSSNPYDTTYYFMQY